MPVLMTVQCSHTFDTAQGWHTKREQAAPWEICTQSGSRRLTSLINNLSRDCH